MRTRFPFASVLFHALGFALATSLLASVPARAQVTLMPTHDERLDGHTEDIAGPTIAVSSPENKRVWIAQGRVRAAIRISDRMRMFAEDKSFNSSEHPENNEKILAVEVDEVNQRLYTLTERAVYRESITNPTSPGPAIHFDFRKTSPAAPEQNVASWEGIEDVKLWAENGGITSIFVMTAKRIITLQDDGSQLLFRGWTRDMFPPGPLPATDPTFSLPGSHCSPGLMEELRVNILRRMRVLQDANGQVMAYVIAQMSGYYHKDFGRPLASMVIACYLDSPNGYLNPTFDMDPGANVEYQFWNSMPVPPSPPSSTPSVDHTIYGIDAFSLAGQRYLYLACGKVNNLRRMLVTNAYPKTCTTPAWSPEDPLGVAAGAHFLNVLADRLDPQRFFAVREDALHVVDTIMADPYFDGSTVYEFFAAGCPRDMIQIGMQSPLTKSLWTAVDGKADHICKVINVSANVVPVPVPHEYFSMGVSDGGVALGDDIYLPTWGGVVRYGRLSGQAKWQVVPDSYVPAEVTETSGAKKVFQTEHIDKGRVDNADRLFIPPGQGELLEFKVDGTTKNPDPPSQYRVDIAKLPSGFSSYPASVYSNDAAFLSLGPGNEDKFVLVDLTQFEVVIAGNKYTLPGVLAYQWKVGDTWEHVASSAVPPIALVQDQAELTNTITIARGSSGKTFAIVAHTLGFFTVDVTGLNLPPGPAMTWVSSICTADPSCGSNGGVSALATNRDRIFVYVNHPEPEIRVYAWNMATGDVDPNWLNLYAETAFLPPNTTSLGDGVRGRFRELDSGTGAGYVYFAVGHRLLQMSWPGSSSATLTLTRWWESDYRLHLQDCRYYDFSGGISGLLVVKDSESFAIVAEQ